MIRRRRKNRKTNASSSRTLRFESLEDRRMLAVWKGAANADFNEGKNWRPEVTELNSMVDVEFDANATPAGWH